MEVEAIARYMRIPPRKARLVAATVVGLPVREALTVLDFTPRAAAKEVAKVVKSAAANATNNFSQDEDTLFVKSIVVNEGPTLKRGRARARGMYFSIFKRTCHITAVVDTREITPTTRRRRAAASGAPVGRAAAAGAPVSGAVASGASAAGKASKAPAAKGEAKAEKPKAEKTEKASAAAKAVEQAEEESRAVAAEDEAEQAVPTPAAEQPPTEKPTGKAAKQKKASDEAGPDKEKE
jgi:large subunit ribosomal protein L22